MIDEHKDEYETFIECNRGTYAFVSLIASLNEYLIHSGILSQKSIIFKYFVEENINTLEMSSEFVLTILSSVAQQESENISNHVKLGFKAKMERGEMIGFNGCLGYDYDPNTKSLSVNEDEKKIVQYIYNRYIQGYRSNTNC